MRWHWLEPAAVSDFVVEVSTDAVRWYPVEAVADEEGVRGELFETNRRYLRVRVVEASDPGRVGLRNLAVYGWRSEPMPRFPEGPETLGWARPLIPLLPYRLPGVDNPVVSLNGEWHYSARPPAGFWRDSVEPSEWATVPVPGNLPVLLGVEVMEVEQENGGGWLPSRNVETAYKRKILIPESFEGKRVMLRFDSAFTFARVWVNGRLLRTHRGGFTPFYVDATDVVEAGREAWVTVGLTAEAPFAEYTHIRGMIADVHLVAMAQDYPSRLQVFTEFDDQFLNARLRIETGVVFNQAEEADLVLRLMDRDGNPVDIGESRVRVTASEPEAVIEREISRPRHWTAETPYLYTVRADLEIGGDVVQTIERRFGFRDVEVRGNKFYVNGKQVKLRGVNWHQSHPFLGIAVSREHDLESLRMLRDANVNLIRTSHWPQFEHILQAADELGFYVLQESSVMFVGWPDRGEMLDDPDYLDSFMDQFADMMELSLSHPSVIIWSTANESRWGENIRHTQRYAHAIDPDARPTIFSWGHQAPPDGYEIFSHHYPGLGGTYSRADFPVLFDEYAHPYTHSDAWIDFDPAFRDFYGESLRYFWDAIYQADGGLGGAIWHSRDKLFFRPDGVWNGFLARWGLLDVWNRPKPELYHTRAAYSPVRIEERILNPGETRYEVEVENRFHHTNLKDLTITWRSGDEEGRLPGPDIAPMTKGSLRLPERNWDAGDRLRLGFLKEEVSGRVREVYRHEFDVGHPVVAFRGDAVPRPVLIEEPEEMIVRGEGFELRFDRSTGQIAQWRHGDELVVIGGPHLNLGYDGGLPGGPVPAPDGWQLDEMRAREAGDRIEIRSTGRYPGAEVEFRMLIDGVGVVEILYGLSNVAIGYDAVGVAFDLVGSADRLSWIRQGLWSAYPENHVGRNRGVAHRRALGAEVEVYGQWPQRDWAADEKDFHLYGKDDTAGRGTRDFRASRPAFVIAALSLEDRAVGLQAAGTRRGAVKASVNPDQTVRLNLNSDWSHPGFTGWGANPYRRDFNLPNGYTHHVTVRLSEAALEDALHYVFSEEMEQVALAELHLTGGRIRGETSPERHFYRAVVQEDEARLHLRSMGEEIDIYVNGRRSGTGRADVLLAASSRASTVRIELRHQDQPISESYFLTFLRSDNLALERIVKASGALSNHGPEMLVDGNLSTQWSASNTGEWSTAYCDEWVVVDLDDVTTIGRWVVHHAEGQEIYRTRNFQLEYSREDADGPWEIADQVRDNREATTDRRLERPVEARYVRLRVTKKAGEGAQWPAVRIAQLKLFAP